MDLTIEEVVTKIIHLHDELAFLRGEELDAEMNAYLSCLEPSLEARKRAGKYGAAQITKEVWKLEGELASAIEWKFHLLRKLNNA